MPQHDLCYSCRPGPWIKPRAGPDPRPICRVLNLEQERYSPEMDPGSEPGVTGNRALLIIVIDFRAHSS